MTLTNTAMQPSSKAAQSVSAAAEALFETKTVSEIRQIEARTRKDIDGKNLKLRQLVGDSHRDLIDGTDKVIEISAKCHAVVANILAIQESFGGLAATVTTASNNGDGKDFVRKHQELHAVGSRVKYIMDTPEVIWGCLEAQQHLDAARRLLRVHEVHNQLQTAFAADLAAKFPLLSHQWPLVLNFRQQVHDLAASTISGKCHLSSQTAADAVAAIALLDDLDSAAALQQFLAGRKRCAEQMLDQALADTLAGGQDAGQVLAQLVQQVQSCIAQVGQMLADRPSSSKDTQPDSSECRSLLQQLLQEDEADVSELYFGGANGSAEGRDSLEAVAWRQKSSDTCQRLMPLSQHQVQHACSSWLTQVAAACSQQGLQLLQRCTSAENLVESEQAVQHALISWAPEAIASAAATADQHGISAAVKQEWAPGPGRSLSSTPAAAATPRHGFTRGKVATEWDVTCEHILGERADLWQVLLHEPFLARCKQITSEALETACSSIEQPLAAALRQAAQHEPESAGQLNPGIWPSFSSHSAVLNGIVLDRSYSLGTERTSAGAWNAAPAALGYTQSGVLVGMLSNVSQQATDAATPGNFRNEVHNIKQMFDNGLHAALQAVLLLTAATADVPGQLHKLHPTSSQPLSRFSSLASAPSLASASSETAGVNTAAGSASAAVAAACTAAGRARAADLEQHMQQQCVGLAEQLAKQLEQQLQQLQEQEQPTGANAIEQILLIARLCSAVATNSNMLPVLLGASDTWPAAARAGPSFASGSGSSPLPASIAQGISGLGPAAAALLRMHHPELLQQSASAPSAAAAQLISIQHQLHGIACAGYAQWAKWVASSLSGGLLAALSSDEMLHSDVMPCSWAETTVATGGGEAAAAGGSLLDSLEDAAAAGDMKFHLPAVPSAAVLQMLDWACWETRRAGEHLITTDALQLLHWELHGAVLKVLQQLISTAVPTRASVGLLSPGNTNSNISEKGVLQLLFDQKLLRAVVGAGQPLDGAAAAAGGSAAGAAAAEIAARQRLVTSVEQQLQDQLDPIDWATYEHHLWTNVQKYYQRTSVLLGTLAQLHKPYADTARMPTASNDLNALNLLPVAPRFHYLPVSTPTALHNAAALKQRLGGTAAATTGAREVAAGVPSAATVASPLLSLASISAAVSDLAAQYAFTDLSSSSSTSRAVAAGRLAAEDAAGRQATAAGGGLPGTADAAAAAGTSALSAIQARLQGSSFGALGSMLGDRAAEVTAMAQNFGDLLPSSTGLGGLSGGLLSTFGRRDGSHR